MDLRSWSLINDAKRDIKGIGWAKVRTGYFPRKAPKPGERVKNGSGIMFLTYDTLRWKFNNIGKTALPRSMICRSVSIRSSHGWQRL